MSTQDKRARAIKTNTGNTGGQLAPVQQTSALPLPHRALATAPELAAILKVSRRTVDNYTKSRRIPYLKIGASVRFNVPDVMAALAKFTVKEVTN